jgi:glycosyltransferase involved in cell wall biosynthesis
MLQRSPTPARTLHVLVATPTGVSGQGGIDRIMYGLQSELARQETDGLEVRFGETRGSGHVALSILYVLRFCFWMLVARLTGRVDLVHLNISVQGSTYRKMVIAEWARLLGIPYVLHLHGAEYQSFWSVKHSLRARLIRRLFEGAARVIVLGSMWRDFVARQAPGTAGRIVIVPNATEIPKLPKVGGGATVHILFLGRIGSRKGVPQLGEALRRMHDLPGWRATIAGDGEVETARRIAAEMGLTDRVTLPGWVGSDTVAKLVSEADILVLPSFAENLPMSVIEGMASGLAVVATPVGAVEDIIVDGVSGLLVSPGDVEELTDALTKLVRDPTLRARLGEAALAVHRERLELGAFARAIGEVWQAAAAAGGADEQSAKRSSTAIGSGAIRHER